MEQRLREYYIKENKNIFDYAYNVENGFLRRKSDHFERNKKKKKGGNESSNRKN